MRLTNTLSTRLRDASSNGTKIHGTSPAAQSKASPSNRNWQTGFQQSSAHSTMAFKNEVVSDADIDRYNLPFPKGEGRWWTRDAERDYYLWGGLVGNLAYEETQEGRFHLFINGVEYRIYVQPGQSIENNETQETKFQWTQISEIQPKPLHNEEKKVVQVLKEALSCYGFDGRRNIFYPSFSVAFDF